MYYESPTVFHSFIATRAAVSFTIRGSTAAMEPIRLCAILIYCVAYLSERWPVRYVVSVLTPRARLPLPRLSSRVA